MSKEKQSGNKQFLLITFGILGLLFLWLFIPFCSNFLEYKDKTKYAIVLGNLKNWSVALEKYHEQKNEYPVANNIAALKEILTPNSCDDRTLRLKDSWGTPYIIKSTKNNYLISSLGSDRSGGHEFGGAIDSLDYNLSTTIKDGIFVQHLKFRDDLVLKYENEIKEIKSKE